MDRHGRDAAEATDAGDDPSSLQAAFHSMADAVTVHDADGDILAVNETASELLDRPPAALRETTVAELAAEPDLDGEAVLERLRRVAETGESCELRVETGDGETTWVEVRTSRTRDETTDRMVSVLRELEATDRLERAHGEEPERFRRLVERSSDGVAVVQDERFVYANDAMAELVGRSRERLAGTDVREVVAPEYHESLLERHHERLRGEQPPEDSEVEVVTADGGRRHVRLSASRVQYRGEPAALMRYHDITERKRREQALQSLATRLELVLAETNTGVWEWNLDTDELRWDETSERLFGYDAGEFPEVYEGFADRVHPEDLPEVEAEVERAVENDALFQTNFRVRQPDGEVRWLQARGVLRDRDDEHRWMIGVQTDITEQKRTERELAARTSRLELLNRIVRHDIRNDMEVVLSSASLVEAVTDDDRVLQRVEEIRRAGEHVVELTETVRDLVEAVGEEGRVGPVALDGVLEAAVSGLRADDAVTVRAPESFPSVRVLADDGLRTVFDNLLSNAVRHNDSDAPTVTVSVTERAERVLVRVADDGPGVPDDRRDVVFARGEKGLESPGSGLGLYLVDRLVDDYGGEVWIEDNDPQGAVFVVSLRRADAETAE